jgi:hypothetical protein
MVAVPREAAAELSGRCSTDDDTVRMVIFGMRRSLAYEAVSDGLYDDLETVLGEAAKPAPAEVPAVAERLRASTTKLVEIVPYLLTPYPTDEMRRVINLSAEQPQPEEARGHLVRLALAILSLLDLMGDAAS